MHDRMIHDYGPGRKLASAHVEMPAEADPRKTHATLDGIEKQVEAEMGIVLTLHYDPIVTAKVKRRPEGRASLPQGRERPAPAPWWRGCGPHALDWPLS